jgi:hypothetical protein
MTGNQEARKIEVSCKVRAVQVYEVVRMESTQHGGSVTTYGRFDTKEQAETIAALLRGAGG